MNTTDVFLRRFYGLAIGCNYLRRKIYFRFSTHHSHATNGTRVGKWITENKIAGIHCSAHHPVQVLYVALATATLPSTRKWRPTRIFGRKNDETLVLVIL